MTREESFIYTIYIYNTRMSVRSRKGRIEKLIKMLKSARSPGGNSDQTTITGEPINTADFIHMSTFMANAAYQIGVTTEKIFDYLKLLEGMGQIRLNTPHGCISFLYEVEE